jgi:hypothetical protein
VHENLRGVALANSPESLYSASAAVGEWRVTRKEPQ